jgi:hypothetical protein
LTSSAMEGADDGTKSKNKNGKRKKKNKIKNYKK